jgi:predicted cobalt transporter CbtA
MRDLSLGNALKSALIAGVVAGLAAAAFHFLATEPLIERAIQLETLRHQAEGTYEEPMVSRDAQHVGLFVGFVLYGLTWSVLFGSIYHLAQRWLPDWSLLRRGLFLAVAGYWSVALFPFLKFPANPPGVGDPDTIAYRQALYLGVLAISVAGTAFSMALARSGHGRWRYALGFLAVFAIAVYLLLPGNPDRISMPSDIVNTFRWLSIAGLTLFWAVLGLTFGLLLRRQATRGALRSAPGSGKVVVA